MFIDDATSWLDGTRSALTVAVTPVVVAADLPNRSARDLGEIFSTREDMRRRISELESERILLKVKTEKMAALQRRTFGFVICWVRLPNYRIMFWWQN